MAKLGTAFVEVQPDFSAFDRLVSRKLAGSFRGTGEQAGRDFGDAFKRRAGSITVPKVTVDADTAKARLALAAIEAQKDRISATKAEVKVDVDRSVFSRVSDSIQGLVTSLGGSGGGGVGGGLARVSAGFVSFGASLGPVLAVVGTLAVAIGVSLAGALAALAASFGAAIAGAAALGVALAAVAGPAVALGVLVGSRLTKIFEALKAQDAAAGSSAAGSQAAAAAAQQLTAAERNLTEATRQAGIARSAAFREMQDAAEKASDAIRQIPIAEESLDQARLNTDKAKLALAQFREEAGAAGQAFGAVFSKFTDVSVDTSGLQAALAKANAATGGSLDQSQDLELRQKILDVRQARLQEKEATDGVSDAQRAATRAQQDNNKFKREGIRASESYRAALRGVQSATLAVAAAQRQSDAGTSAQSKAATLVGKLDKTEQSFLRTLKRVRTELRGAFGPATDAVIGGLNKALGRTPQLINPLRGAFHRLGEAAGKSLDRVSADIVKPKTVASFRRFTDTAAKLAGPITDGLLALFHIFLDIANAALPHLVSGTRKVSKQLQDWSVGTSNSKKLGKTIGTLVGHLKTWLGVGAAIGDVFLAFLESAAGPGQSLAESIKGLAERTATWLRSTEGREQLKQFFKDAIAFAKDFAKFLAAVVVAAVKFGETAARVFHEVTDKIGGPKNAAKALLFTLGTLAAFKLTAGVFNSLRTLRDNINSVRKAATLLHSKFFANTAEDAGAGLVSKAKTALSSIGSALASTGRAVVEAGRRVARRLIAIFATQGALAGAAGGRAAAGAEGLASPGVASRMTRAGSAAGKLFGIGLAAVALVEIANADFTRDLGRKINNALPGKNESKARSDWFQQASDSGLTFKEFAKKHPIPRATGGPIPGTGNRDTVPILATPGEFMTRKRIVQRIGMGVMADINAGRLDPRVGYGPGEQPSLTTRPVRGPKFASGGLVGARPVGGERPHLTINSPITVPGGGPPDPVALGVAQARTIESRLGGLPRQD